MQRKLQFHRQQCCCLLTMTSGVRTRLLMLKALTPRSPTALRAPRLLVATRVRPHSTLSTVVSLVLKAYFFISSPARRSPVRRPAGQLWRPSWRLPCRIRRLSYGLCASSECWWLRTRPAASPGAVVAGTSWPKLQQRVRRLPVVER